MHPIRRSQLDLQRRFFGDLAAYLNIRGFVGCLGLEPGLGETCFDAKNADWQFTN